jgi:hypothetical protein
MHTTRTSPVRHRRAAAAAALTLATLLAACGGGSSSDGASGSSDETTAPTEAPADGGTSSGDGSTTTEAAGAADVDICGEITQADMEAIIPNATFSTVAPNTVIPTPTCDYSIEIAPEFEGAVIQIQQSSPDGAYYDGQKDLQSDAVDVEGVSDAFSFNDGGSIILKTSTGSYSIIRGVEPAPGAPAVSEAQMAAIAKLVAEL